MSVENQSNTPDTPKEKLEEGIFVLPGGYFGSDGVFYKEVKCRPLTGREEELLADKNRSGNGAALVTALLGNCVERIGQITTVTPDVIRDLLVGDRDYILVKLRQLTFGSRVQGTITCPNPACGEKIDIDFDLSQIDVGRKENLSPTFSMELSPLAAYRDEAGREHRTVEFRLPNGGDQEAIADLISSNEAKAMTKLLARCIQRIGDISEVDEPLVLSLTILARREIEEQMTQRAPKLDLTMEGECPECQRILTIPFDLHGFFLAR